MKKIALFVLTAVFLTAGAVFAADDSWDIPAWQEEETEEAAETPVSEEAVQEKTAGDDVLSTADSTAPVEPVKKGDACFFDKTLLQGAVMSADVVLACWAIYAFFDLKSGEAAYDERYSSLDPVLHDSDETLARLQDEKETKGLISGVAAGIAAAAIAYTVLDYLQLHIVFPAEITAAAVPGGFVMTAQIKF